MISVLAIKQPRRIHLVDFEASPTGAYLTIEQESGMKSLTEDVWIRQVVYKTKLLWMFLGTRPSGEVRKWRNGGVVKGATIRPAAHSLRNFVSVISGWFKVLLRLEDSYASRSPTKCTRKPKRKPSMRYLLRTESYPHCRRFKPVHFYWGDWLAVESPKLELRLPFPYFQHSQNGFDLPERNIGFLGV